MNIKKTLENAILPLQDGETGFNTINFSVAAIGTGQGKDNVLIIEYKAGLSVEVPDGYVGIVSPLKTAFVNSLVMPTSFEILTPGWNEIITHFKTNTNAIPSIYEVGDEFCRLTIIKNDTFSLIEVKEDTSIEVSSDKILGDIEETDSIPENADVLEEVIINE